MLYLMSYKFILKCHLISMYNNYLSVSERVIFQFKDKWKMVEAHLESSL